MAPIKAIVCPLDWGLGHATRCVPVIRELRLQGFEVEIGCSPLQHAFFAQELPDCILHAAPSYAIRYPTQGWQMPFWLLTEYRRLQKVIHEEQLWIERLCEQRNASLVISDNRFGCYSRHHPSIYITHQLRIAFPRLFQIFEPLGQYWHSTHRRHFHATWVPDFDSAPGLAGKLSHIPNAHNIRYIGPLSRFPNSEAPKMQSPEIDFLALLSGPEPQRTLFEEQVSSVLNSMPGRHQVVRGLPGAPPFTPHKKTSIQWHNHLPTELLVQAINNSRYIICRPGYSTLMDLTQLGAKAIMVPTPGQTEQIYLAHQLAQSGQVATLSQNQFSKESLLQVTANAFHLPYLKKNNSLLKEAISGLHTLF